MHIIMTRGIIFIFSLHLIETICVNIYARHKRMAVKTPIIFQSRDIYGNKFSLTQKLQLFHFTAFFHSFCISLECCDKKKSMNVKILISLFTQLSFNYFISGYNNSGTSFNFYYFFLFAAYLTFTSKIWSNEF